MPKDNYSLFNDQGQRKYLNLEERDRYFQSIDRALSKPEDREKRTFALLLYYTGCRISEGLGVSYSNIDYSSGGVVFNTLKRRKDNIYRFVPLPETFLTKLDDVHRVKDYQSDRVKGTAAESIWSYSRTTAWRIIDKVMKAAEITGPQATPKGLRHSFVIKHQDIGTPEHLIQRWAGWASRDMMEVYGNAIGQEERTLASRFWE